MKRPRKDAWTTYRTTDYTHAVTNDQASAGDVHLHQVRKTAARWETRIVQSNGKHQSATEPQYCDPIIGQQHFDAACGLALETYGRRIRGTIRAESRRSVADDANARLIEAAKGALAIIERMSKAALFHVGPELTESASQQLREAIARAEGRP